MNTARRYAASTPALPFANLPVYELRRKASRGKLGEYALEIWQLPSPPRLGSTRRSKSRRCMVLRCG